MEGHLLAPLMEERQPSYPFLALLVSGGHTLLVRVESIGDYKLVSESIDDAVGEAFDKTAKLLGLPFAGLAGELPLGVAEEAQTRAATCCQGTPSGTRSSIAAPTPIASPRRRPQWDSASPWRRDLRKDGRLASWTSAPPSYMRPCRKVLLYTWCRLPRRSTRRTLFGLPIGQFTASGIHHVCFKSISRDV